MNSPLAHSVVFERRGMLVVCVAAAALAFWFWHSQADTHRSPGTDPAGVEQEARDHPNDVRAQLAWAEALMRERRLDEATTILEGANRLAPNDARPYALQGIIAAGAHEEKDARSLFYDALQRDPSDTTALRGLANLDAKAQHIRAAIEGFQKLVQLQPRDADAWQGLGLLFIRTGENYRSLDALTHAATLAPNDIITERALGNMALFAGRLDQANTAFHRVLAQVPNDPQAMIGLAGVMMRMDSSAAGLATAEKQADAAITMAPTALAYDVRGQIRMTEHHFAEAIQDLNTSRSLEPNHRQTYLLLSQCYASAGKAELAKQMSAQFEKLTAKKLARDRALSAAPETNK